MLEKFQNKFQIRSTRLQHCDYGDNGAYFITICTNKCVHFFFFFIETPNLEGSIMNLNEIGKLVEQFWIELPNYFSFIELGNFVVMPDHVHGVLIINKMEEPTPKLVETPNFRLSTNQKTAAAMEKWKPGTIATIINQYKRICTINARIIRPDFAWQPNNHDLIIRSHAD